MLYYYSAHDSTLVCDEMMLKMDLPQNKDNTDSSKHITTVKVHVQKTQPLKVANHIVTL